jgi:hypothetical protein
MYTHQHLQDISLTECSYIYGNIYNSDKLGNITKTHTESRRIEIQKQRGTKQGMEGLHFTVFDLMTEHDFA